MRLKRVTGLVAAIAASTTILAANAANAQSLNLRNERSDLFDAFNALVNEEREPFAEVSLQQLDSSMLFWNGVDPVDVFFINEGAGFRNQLFFSINNGDQSVIFDDIASPESILSENDGPLALGDGERLGKYEGETQVDFFLKANGANGGTNLYGGDVEANPDGLQHLIAYNYYDEVEDQNWVILGFEDLFGEYGAKGGPNEQSDRDFNDVVFAVRGVTGAPVETPEPSVVLSFLGLGLAGGLRQLRHHKDA